VQEFILQPANGVNVKGHAARQWHWHNENHADFPSHFPCSRQRYRPICKQLPKVMNYAQLAGM